MTSEPSPARRYFTRSEITAAWLRQGRACAECRRDIPRDLIEGDHIQPWSQRGPTVPANLQVLCVACNRRKGNRATALPDRPSPPVTLSTSPLWEWQREALSVVDSTSGPVLIEACPGAGKTRFALELAARMLQADEVNRVLIVVPTVRLVEQWVDAATGSADGSATLPLAPVGWRPTQPIYEPWCGAVFTYQALFAQTTMCAALASEPGFRTLVIFDEVHHAGSDSGWGIGAQQAFAQAATRIVSLSGTPFREVDPIVFVRTRDRRSLADYRYSYGDALRDSVCRPLRFVQVGGTTTFRAPDTEVHTVSFDDDLNSQGESYRLRTALAAGGDHIRFMIETADAELRRLRAAGDADAAGLVVCMDCDHADEVAQVLAARNGSRPIVACSRLNNPDDPSPIPAIDAFTKGNQPWIVAVRMVSEGVDIRRLRVVVYATNVVTELGFRQIIGRVVRVDNGNANDFGVVVMPADPRLAEFADRIKSEAPVEIQEQIVIEDADTGRISLAPGPNGTFEPIASDGSIGTLTDTHGRIASADLFAAAQRYVGATGSSISPFELALAASDDPELRVKLLQY